MSDFLQPHELSSPGSSVHGILHTRILEWVARTTLPIILIVYIHSSSNLLAPQFLGFPSEASGKEPTCHAGDLRDAGSIPRLGRSPGGGHGNPLHPMDRGAWQATVHRVAQSWTRLKRLSQACSSCTSFFLRILSPSFGRIVDLAFPTFVLFS